MIDTDNSGEIDIDEYIKAWRTFAKPRNQAQVRSQIASTEEPEDEEYDDDEPTVEEPEDEEYDDDEPTVEEPEDQSENAEYDDEN